MMKVSDRYDTYLWACKPKNVSFHENFTFDLTQLGQMLTSD